MLSRYFRPRPPLADYVDVFWLYEGCRHAHAMERCLPTGTMQVIVNLRADSLRVYDSDQGDGRRMTTIREPLIAGPRDEYTFVDAAQIAIMSR